MVFVILNKAWILLQNSSAPGSLVFGGQRGSIHKRAVHPQVQGTLLCMYYNVFSKVVWGTRCLSFMLTWISNVDSFKADRQPSRVIQKWDVRQTLAVAMSMGRSRKVTVMDLLDHEEERCMMWAKRDCKAESGRIRLNDLHRTCASRSCLPYKQGLIYHCLEMAYQSTTCSGPLL